jgi:hypothetical protein
MKSFLHRLIGRTGARTQGRPAPSITRQVHPEVEAMEDRLLLSAAHPFHHPRHPVRHPARHARHAKPVATPPAPSNRLGIQSVSPVQAADQFPQWTIQNPRLIVNVHDFSGALFVMQSEATGIKYQLRVQSETWNPDGSANFTGRWGSADGPAITDGRLEFDPNGGIKITFSWVGGTHSFTGHLTTFGGLWFIDGQVTVQGGGGPGRVLGQQNLNPDLTNVQFGLAGPDGTMHQLLIQSETLNADGTATFTGAWDFLNNSPGAAVTGGMSQDAQGTFVSFAWGNDHSFAGHATFVRPLLKGGLGALSSLSFGRLFPGLPLLTGHWHLDGQVTVQGGNGPVQVAGDQNFNPDLTGVRFVMTEGNGNSHQLLIQSESCSVETLYPVSARIMRSWVSTRR